jgi:soluble lytic murein transglycosylase-like protein
MTVAMTIALVMAAAATDVPVELLQAVCERESGCRESAYLDNDKGSPSYGAFQIKLGTAKDMGYSGTPARLMVPVNNALYAAEYLKHQKERYGTWEKAVSAFNCGHSPCRNKKYVNDVMRRYHVLYELRN